MLWYAPWRKFPFVLRPLVHFISYFMYSTEFNRIDERETWTDMNFTKPPPNNTNFERYFLQFPDIGMQSSQVCIKSHTCWCGCHKFSSVFSVCHFCTYDQMSPPKAKLTTQWILCASLSRAEPTNKICCCCRRWQCMCVCVWCWLNSASIKWIFIIK